MNAEPRALTRNAQSVLRSMEDDFRSLYCADDFLRKINAVERASGRSDGPSRLRELYRMLDDCGLPYEKGRKPAYYRELVKQSRLPDVSQLEGKILYAIYSHFREYPAPENYMQRIVDTMCNEEDGWSGDPLRLRILKQFVRYGGCLTYQRPGPEGKPEKVVLCEGRGALKKYLKKKLGRSISQVEDHADDLEDDVFDVLAAATKAQTVPRGTYGLLKLCDDLAYGRFRTGGGTKRALYYLAMAYGMTYYPGSEKPAGIRERDVEVNLFLDYYNCNLMRYADPYMRSHLEEYEREPTGQGINYKNFAEVIYLYYIASELSPAEKLRGSNEMIRSVMEQARGRGEPLLGEEEGDTQWYRDLVLEDTGLRGLTPGALRLPEDRFREFILTHYSCDPRQMEAGKNEFQFAAQQNSAFEEYSAILDKLRKHADSLEEYSYGLYLIDGQNLTHGKNRWLLESLQQSGGPVDEEKLDDFAGLLSGLNRFIGCENFEHIPRALQISSPEKMTRTSLLVACYYYFNVRHLHDGPDRHKTFREVFDAFKVYADGILDAAGYQPVSFKSILDVLAAFSSYVYLNSGMD